MPPIFGYSPVSHPGILEGHIHEIACSRLIDYACKNACKMIEHGVNSRDLRLIVSEDVLAYMEEQRAHTSAVSGRLISSYSGFTVMVIERHSPNPFCEIAYADCAILNPLTVDEGEYVIKGGWLYTVQGVCINSEGSSYIKLSPAAYRVYPCCAGNNGEWTFIVTDAGHTSTEQLAENDDFQPSQELEDYLNSLRVVDEAAIGSR